MVNLQEKLADKLENVRWADSYFYCLCPKHDDHRNSMLVWKDYFKCYGCGFQGRLEKLEAFIGSTPVKSRPSSKSIILPQWRNWEKRYGDMPEIVQVAHRNVLNGNDVYFKHRKIDQFIEPGMFGLLDGWAVFPVFNRNKEVIDVVVRAIRQMGAKYVVSIYNQDERPLYVPNWDRVLKSDHLFVVYGIITAWALEAIGEPVVTGITGKSLKASLLDPFQLPITVVPDYNEEKDAAHLVSQLGWRGKLKLIDWPDFKCEDLDDVRNSGYDLSQLVGA